MSQKSLRNIPWVVMAGIYSIGRDPLHEFSIMHTRDECTYTDAAVKCSNRRLFTTYLGVGSLRFKKTYFVTYWAV